MDQIIQHDCGLYVVSGRNGSGKSSFALHQCIRLMQDQNKRRAREGRAPLRWLTNMAIRPQTVLQVHGVEVEQFSLPWPCPTLHPELGDWEHEHVLYPLVHDRKSKPLHWDGSGPAELEEVQDAIVLVDEVHKFFEGKRVLPPDLTNMIAEKRKRSLTIIVLTPPLANVPPGIRRSMDKWVECIDSTQDQQKTLHGLIQLPPLRLVRVYLGEKMRNPESVHHQERNERVLACYDTQGGTFGFLPEDIPNDDVQRSRDRYAKTAKGFAIRLVAMGLLFGLAFRALWWAFAVKVPQAEQEQAQRRLERVAQAEQAESARKARKAGKAVPATQVSYAEALGPSLQPPEPAPPVPEVGFPIPADQVRPVGEDRDGRRIVRHTSTKGRWFVEVAPGRFEEFHP